MKTDKGMICMFKKSAFALLAAFMLMSGCSGEQAAKEAGKAVQEESDSLQKIGSETEKSIEKSQQSDIKAVTGGEDTEKEIEDLLGED